MIGEGAAAVQRKAAEVGKESIVYVLLDKARQDYEGCTGNTLVRAHADFLHHIDLTKARELTVDLPRKEPARMEDIPREVREIQRDTWQQIRRQCTGIGGKRRRGRGGGGF